jgi:hypothetical protein
MRDFERSSNISGDRSVNSDPSTAIHPSRRARRRNRFRAVFVLVFVGGYYALWFFGHSLRISRKANGERRNQAAQSSVTEFSKRRKRDGTGLWFGLVGPALYAGPLRAPARQSETNASIRSCCRYGWIAAFTFRLIFAFNPREKSKNKLCADFEGRGSVPIVFAPLLCFQVFAALRIFECPDCFDSLFLR